MTDKEFLSLSQEAKKIYDSISNFCLFECPILKSSAESFRETIMQLTDKNSRLLLITYLEYKTEGHSIEQIRKEIEKKKQRTSML